jgi:hypothetical protein
VTVRDFYRASSTVSVVFVEWFELAVVREVSLIGSRLQSFIISVMLGICWCFFEILVFIIVIKMLRLLLVRGGKTQIIFASLIN